MLVEAGVSIDATDIRGKTVLHHFSFSLDEIVKMIDGLGRWDAVLVSTRASALQCLELVVRLSADPGVEDNEGQKPVDVLRGRHTAEHRAFLGSELAALFRFDEEDSTGVSQEARP